MSNECCAAKSNNCCDQTFLHESIKSNLSEQFVIKWLPVLVPKQSACCDSDKCCQ